MFNHFVASVQRLGAQLVTFFFLPSFLLFPSLFPFPPAAKQFSNSARESGERCGVFRAQKKYIVAAILFFLSCQNVYLRCTKKAVVLRAVRYFLNIFRPLKFCSRKQLLSRLLLNPPLAVNG